MNAPAKAQYRSRPEPSQWLARAPSLQRVRKLDSPRVEILLLVAMVAAAAVTYTLFSLRIRTFQPDEWYFTELARLTAHDFPAALWKSGIYLRGIERVDQLFLTIPYALFGTPTSYEVAHVIQALLYASAAVPVWLLGRAAGLGRAARMLATALVLAAPWAIVSTSFLAEPAAYPAYAWVLCTTWYAATRPSRKMEVLALAALALAALSRTQFLALPPILPLAIVWQEWRWELAREPWRSRLRELPRRCWSRHPIITVISALALLAILANAAGLLPGGGIGALAGGYGLPHVESVSAEYSRARYYLSRMAVGTGLVALALGSAWVLRTLARPRREGLHALAAVCTLGLLGLLASIVTAGPDERYLLYGAVPIALAFSAELDSRRASERMGLAGVICIAACVTAVILLIESVTWPSSAGPYDFFVYPAAVFYGRAVLGKLSLVHLPVVHAGPERLVQAAIVVVAIAWVATGYRPRARRPAAVVLGLAVLALCVAQLYYALDKFTTGAGANPGGPTATQRSWVDKAVAAGVHPYELGIGLGGTPAYIPIWRTIDFWNTSVQGVASFSLPERPPIIIAGSSSLRLLVHSPSGVLGTLPAGPSEPPPPLPRYLLVPFQGTNPIGLEGQILGKDSQLPVILVHVGHPARVVWQLGGLNDEGFMLPGKPASATIYSGALGSTAPCASFYLIAPPSFAGSWPYAVFSGNQKVAAGRLVAGQHLPLVVPLRPRTVAGGPLATLRVRVHGKVLFASGSVVSAQLAFFEVRSCPRGLR